jgi:hypothetical protein
MILNLRGIAGSGKSTLGRQIVADYDVLPESLAAEAEAAPPRRRILHLLPHPFGGPSLAVLGAYGARLSGSGCDGVREREGGLAEVFRIAGQMAEEGHDVLLEGLSLSWDHRWSAALARAHPLHVICLAATPQESARHLLVRRRLSREALPRLVAAAIGQAQAVEAACARLASLAPVEVLPYDAALARARGLLGIARAPARAA